MKSQGGHCSTPCNKNEGPFCYDKWSMVFDGIKRNAMPAGFWEEGTWNQWTDEKLLPIISNLVFTQTFHFLFFWFILVDFELSCLMKKANLKITQLIFIWPKVNKETLEKKREECSKLGIKTPEWCQ